MTRHEYDEEASERLYMDVVHEVDDRPTSVARWVDAMRRLNSIDDLLARRLLASNAIAAPEAASATRPKTM